MTIKVSDDASRRTIYRLGCSHSSHVSKLDFRSHLAAEWAERWVLQHGGLKTPKSGLIRRALSLYVDRLQSLSPDEARSEVYRVSEACKGTHTSPEDVDAAQARMEAAGGPLEPFEVILLGQYQVDQMAALMRHLEPFNHIPGPRGTTTTKKEKQS